MILTTKQILKLADIATSCNGDDMNYEFLIEYKSDCTDNSGNPMKPGIFVFDGKYPEEGFFDRLPDSD